MMIPMYRLYIGYDYTACMDYMDPDGCPLSPQRPVNLITHSPFTLQAFVNNWYFYACLKSIGIKSFSNRIIDKMGT